jgi:hypothetical protein
VMGDENILMVQYYNWQEKKNKKCLLAFSEWRNGKTAYKQTDWKHFIFCWPCIIMYHNNVTNLIYFHFHNHFIVSGVKCPSSGGTTLAVDPQLATSQELQVHATHTKNC